jgi:superfamily I DNA/RNA helicase
VPFRAPRIELLLDSPVLDDLLERAGRAARDGDLDAQPAMRALGVVRREIGFDPHASAATRELATALLAWAAAFADLPSFVGAVHAARVRLGALRRDDASLTLATAHATKGLEFDHVIVVGMEAGRFPSGRTVAEAEDPVRAYEEERRLAYVAWTRARRTLTLLYDPSVPSPFLLEAFSAEELGLTRAPGAARG